MGIGVCSNLASSGDPHASQNYFNHCYRHRVMVRVVVSVRATARDFLLMRYINLHLLTYLLTYLLGLGLGSGSYLGILHNSISDNLPATILTRCRWIYKLRCVSRVMSRRAVNYGSRLEHDGTRARGT